MERQLFELSATELARLVRARELAADEVLAAHRDRVQRTNPAINAVVELCAAAAPERGPLAGVPITVKDTLDVRGMRRTEGVAAFESRVSPAHCIAVERLTAAGAAIVGKGNQPDFKVRWNTVSGLYGRTRNPRAPELSAGGSSGGDAAAVAAGMAAVGVGTDYGGSIRVPAAFCGIYGLRPGAGRVPDVRTTDPRHGPPSTELLSSIGVLARSVGDLRLVYDRMRGSHPGDPASVAAEDRALDSDPPRLRVARICSQTGAHVESEIEARLDHVCGLLSDAGYEVVEAAMPRAERLPELWRLLVGTELLRISMGAWSALMTDSGRVHLQELFDGVDSIADYAALLTERRALAASSALWMQQHQLVVAPVAGMRPPSLQFDDHIGADATRELFARMRNAVWVNLLGLPAVALPNGIQIVARSFHEQQALTAAATVEQSLPAVTVAQTAGRPT